MIKSYKFRRGLANGVIYFILGLMGIIWVCPFAYLLMHSFRAEATVGVPYLIPKQWTFQNYIDLFMSSGNASINFPRWFLNTLLVAAVSCVISTISVLAVSYTFSRLRFGARKKLMNIAMILGMFPGFMTMIAIYYLLKAMGLNQNLIALMICYSSGAGMGFQISKGFFDTIPRALDEAATIDGATKNRIFWSIILPMSKPIIVYTVAIGLQSMISAEFINDYYKQFLAGAVLVAVPITLLFLKMQKYYVAGVTAGGVKG